MISRSHWRIPESRMPKTPKQCARQNIDAMLVASGWAVQDYKPFDPSASTSIVLLEVPLKSGRCDYLLLVNRTPLGVVEPKKEYSKLSSLADESAHYVVRAPNFLGICFGYNSLLFRSIAQAAGGTKGARTRCYLKTYRFPVPPIEGEKEIAKVFTALFRTLLPQLITA